jgi:hypothetical protein
MKIKDEPIWMNGLRGSCGLALLERDDGTLEIRGSFVEGLDPVKDAQIIADWGGVVDVPKLKRWIEQIEKGN